MTIRTNLSAMNANRLLGASSTDQAKVLEKLSSGFRINRAADDASGLAMSEKMRAQISGLTQAESNAQDGISLIQVAEGALNEVHGCLQRAKELATQASTGTYLDEDRQHIQSEIDSLLKEVDHIASSTDFNNIKILDGSCSSSPVSQEDKQKFVNWLNGSWLNDAAKKVEGATHWKLNSSTKLSVSFESIGDTAVASMSGAFLSSDLKLTINTDFLNTATQYNGTDGPTCGGIPADRLITHEMTHGYMMQNVSPEAAPKAWFTEGLAEAVHGASDSRYASYEIGKSTDFGKINSEIQSFDFSNSKDKGNYTVGYIATSYLKNTVEAKAPGSFKTMLGRMKQSDQSFEELVKEYTGAEYNDFITAFKKDAADATTSGKFDSDFLKTKCGIDITDGKADPIDGADATSSDVVPNGGSASAPSGDVTKLTVGSRTIDVVWKDNSTADKKSNLSIQIGDTVDQKLNIVIKSVKTADLGINNISIVTKDDAQKAIKTFEDAINNVSSMRSSIGAYQNRLEYTMNNLSTSIESTTNAHSRIKDADMAREMMNYTKHNILMEASKFLCAQANQSTSSVLQLLQ